MGFKDLPIKRKLSTAIMLTTSAVVLIASAAFVLNEYISARRELADTVRTIAMITAENSTAAIAFQNRVDANRTLQSLEAEPRIIEAVLYDTNGQPFAVYGVERPLYTTAPKPGLEMSTDELRYVQTVSENQQTLGTLFLRATMSEIYIELRTYLGITGLILLCSFVGAWIFSAALRRRIATPILELADTTRRVSQENNYALRVTKHGQDELGELSDSFNRMMVRIQEADRELRQSQDRLKLALEAGHIGTWDWNPRDHSFFWDRYVYPLIGAEMGAVLPSLDALLSRVHPQDRVQVREALERLFSGSRTTAVSFRVIWPDESIHYLAIRAGLQSDPLTGAPRVTGVIIDITQAKRAEDEVRRLNEELEQRVVKRTEELAAANKELESFTYSVSHDLRAPLRHINGFAQMLEQEFTPQLPPEARRLLTRIRNGAGTMGQLVDDLLRLARVGRQALNHQQCRLNDIVNQVVQELKTETAGRQIEWKIGELPTVECDSGLLRQVFANLVSNAVKYTRTRPVAVIEIQASKTDSEHVVSIRDNGVGFDMKYADKLFGVFQRLHRVDEFEGTGVGLAIVQRIIQKHGGKVWVQAAVDQGACFYFSLPLDRAGAVV